MPYKSYSNLYLSVAVIGLDYFVFMLIILFVVQVCRECIEERETHEFLTKLNYTNREITVDLVRGKDPPPSLLVASSGFEVERRTSKRARRASATSGGRILVNVSGDTTVFQLKLQIWESLAVSSLAYQRYSQRQVATYLNSLRSLKISMYQVNLDTEVPMAWS